MNVARKLAAILAVDVAGYSRLMGEDETGTTMAVRERREAGVSIARAFGGRLVKTTDDGVLLQLPSIVAAVECAVLMQKMMAERNAALPEAKRILYRIGVNLGDVLIEGDELGGGRVLERAVEHADGGADGLHMTMSCSAEPGMDILLDLRLKRQFAGSASRAAAARAKRGGALEIGRGIRG